MSYFYIKIKDKSLAAEVNVYFINITADLQVVQHVIVVVPFVVSLPQLSH